MKCDELKAYKGDVTIPVYGTIADANVYLKEGVDDAIAELEARIADLEGLNHDLCERVTENDGIRQHWEEIEQTRAENERLKAKLVKQDAKNRRLKRALWRAIALFCGRSCEFFNGIMSHCLMGQDNLYHRCEKKKNKYLNAMYKCKAKAEEYK